VRDGWAEESSSDEDEDEDDDEEMSEESEQSEEEGEDHEREVYDVDICPAGCNIILYNRYSDAKQIYM